MSNGRIQLVSKTPGELDLELDIVDIRIEMGLLVFDAQMFCFGIEHSVPPIADLTIYGPDGIDIGSVKDHPILTNGNHMTANWTLSLSLPLRIDMFSSRSLS